MGLLLFSSTKDASAQEGGNWLQAVANSQLSVTSMSGGTPFLAHPVLNIRLENQLEMGYSVFPVLGDTFKAAGGNYCTVVLAGDSQPMVIPPAGQAVDVQLVGYCLELPNSAAKPDEFADYLPINYLGQANPPVRGVLERARDANLLTEFVTQLAVWQGNAGISTQQLQTQLGEDLSALAPYLAYLVDAAPLPSEPISEIPAVDIILPTAVPQADTVAEPAVTTDQQTAPVTEPVPADAPILGSFTRDQLVNIGIILLAVLLLLTLGIVVAMMRVMRRPAAPRRRPVTRAAAPAQAVHANGTAPTATIEEPVIEHNPAMLGNTRCLICGQMDHETRSCPNIQRPDRVFVPEEDELTLANVDEAPMTGAAGVPALPDIDAFWGRHAQQKTPAGSGEAVSVSTTAHSATALGGSNGHMDDDFYRAAKEQRRTTNNKAVDTAPVSRQNDAETEPITRKSVAYVIRERGKPDVVGSLGDDGGVLSRTSLKDSQILLPQKDISTPHALIRFRADGSVTLKDLRSTNGTFLEGTLLGDGEAPVLEDGDRIRFGTSIEYQVKIYERKLVSIDGQALTRDLSSSDQWLVTRRSLHSVVTNNGQISSPHLLIRPGVDGVSEIRVKDLHSHNPTYVNGNLKLSEQEDGTFERSGQVDILVGDSEYNITVRKQHTPDIVGKHFKVLRQIYISKMADVYEVKDTRDETNRELTAKLLNIYQEKKEESRRAFELEIELMKTVQNEHILPIVEVGHDEDHDAPYFVMPYLRGGDLRRIMQYRRRHSDEIEGLRLVDIEAIFGAVMPAISAIHSANYAHCDIKPANIFITQFGHVVVLDLGVVTKLGEHAEFYTQFYSAPEVGAKELPPVSPASDIYSLGIVLFELLTGREAKEMRGFATEPSADSPDTEQSKPINTSYANLETWLGETEVGMQFIDVIYKATQYEPSERFGTVDEFSAALGAAFAGNYAQAIIKTEGDAALAALSEQVE
jgi:serine/threonine-protein kinase